MYISDTHTHTRSPEMQNTLLRNNNKNILDSYATTAIYGSNYEYKKNK